jgi:hypothetical protein
VANEEKFKAVFSYFFPLGGKSVSVFYAVAEVCKQQTGIGQKIANIMLNSMPTFSSLNLKFTVFSKQHGRRKYSCKIVG